MTRFLCLWFPNWPIQRLLRSRPELKDRSLVLVTSGPRGGLVAECSSEAVAQGVRPHMPLAEAQALAPELAVVPHDPPADRRALKKLAEACERFTPCVALEDGANPECQLLDISNLEHLHASEHNLATQIKNFFTRRGYHTRIAIADTIGLAWALAHFAKSPNDEIRMTNEKPHLSFVIRHSSLEKRAGDLAPGKTVCRVPAPTPASLPIESLRISSDTAALLRELGIETIDQLLLLPREDLASRFGEQLLLRIDQFTGAAPEVIEPHRALPELATSYALDEPTADRAVLLHILSQLVTQLTRQLAARDQGAVRLGCILRTTDNRAVPMQIGLLEPSANPRQLLELIDLRLETISLPDEVDRVELRAAVVGRLSERQRELFSDRWPTDPHQLALLVNRLSSRLGAGSVLRAELRASPMPERTVRWSPATSRGTRKLQNANCKMQIANLKAIRNRKHVASTIDNLQFRAPPVGWSCNLQSSPRPLSLHPQPEALEVVSIAPTGPPQFVWLHRRRERIVHHVGPERIETLWWRGRSVRRDYYRIATESGQHLWIFRELTSARWFLHGEFE